MTKLISLVSAFLLSFCFTVQAQTQNLSYEQALDIAYEVLDYQQFMNVADGVPTVILFQDVNFKGRALVATKDIKNFKKTQSFNDFASSILVFNGAKVKLYLDADFKGPFLPFSKNNANFVALGFNDKASSLKFF